MSSTHRFRVTEAQSGYGQSARPYLTFRLRERNRDRPAMPEGYSYVGQSDPFGGDMTMTFRYDDERAQNLLTAFRDGQDVVMTWETETPA